MIKQAGALVLRQGQALLMSSRRVPGRWVIPKGWIEPGSTPAETAAEECLEEAGVRGRIGESLGHFHYSKHGSRYQVETFRLELESLASEFKEKGQRQYLWLPPEEAALRVDEPELKAMLLELGPPTRLSLPQADAYILRGGTFRFEGAAIFHQQQDWRSDFPPDEEGKVLLQTHCTLLRTPAGLLLVDAGLRADKLVADLDRLGLKPSQIDYLVFTHLHPDHRGGAFDEKGDPIFSQARYLVQPQELEPGFEVAEGLELAGVELRYTGGHSVGHQVVICGDLLMGGDLYPTRRHLDPDRGMSFDLDAAAVAREKEQLAPFRYKVLSHDPTQPLASL